MDTVSKEKRSDIMSRIRCRDTKPEIAVRKFLFALGYRYSIKSNLPGKPDLVFKKRKLAIFINGCFWHMHGCKHSHIPKSNVGYWEEKLVRNKERDAKIKSELNDAGYSVIVLWECELGKSFEETMRRVVAALGSPRFG